MIRSVLLLLACLLLSSCWQSTGLLLDLHGVRAVPDGSYAADDNDGLEKLVWQGNGFYEKTNADGDVSVAVFNVIGKSDGQDLYGVAVSDPSDEDCAVRPGACTWYYMAAKVDGQRVSVAEPDCSNEMDATVATRHGAVDDYSGGCVFSSEKDLQDALRDLTGRIEPTRYQRQ